MKIKICYKCNKRKSIYKFHKRKISKDGHYNWCKLCMKKYSKEYYQENSKEIKIQHKKWEKEHKEETKKYMKKYYQVNKEQIKTKNKKWRENNKRKIKKYKQIHKQQRNKNIRKRRKFDINFKISHNLRTRLYQAIKGLNKSKSTIQLLGCSISELKLHLEKQFKKDMTWDNYGYYGWHIDHIRPCRRFDLSKEKEQRKCFNYINLQPLWGKENLQKQ